MKIIVTRPRLEAEAWVKQLRALHLDAVALPLIHIGAVANKAQVNQARANLHLYSAVMFVSSNAVRYFSLSNMTLDGELIACDAIKNIANIENLENLQNTVNPRMWATGPGTRDALLALSVPSYLIDSPSAEAAQFDSETLWALVKNQVKPGDKVLIVRGSTNIPDADGLVMNGRSWLADQLMAAGVQVDAVISYQRSAPEFDASELALIHQSNSERALWLLSSAEAVTNLTKVAGVNLSKAKAIATHPRIAQTARDAGFGVVYESRPLLKEVAASIESMP